MQNPTFGWDLFWRSSTTDGLYGSGLVEYAKTNSPKVTSSWVGTEWTADVRWRIDQHWQVGAVFADFIAGPAVTQAFRQPRHCPHGGSLRR